MSRTYETFVERLHELADIGHAQGLMSWDQETYMPPRGAAMRARAMGTLAGLYHERLTAPELVSLVADLKDAELTGDAAVNVREIDRQQSRSLKLPKELVVELSQTESLGHEAWIEAREKSDFALFRPWLEKIVALKKEVAERVGYEGAMYNALLDEYEPYARAEEIAPVFAQLKEQLVPLVEQITATELYPARGVLDQEYPIEQQELLGQQVLADMGFDLEAGRLDLAVHPFCAGTSRDDVRLTTRYSADWLPSSLFGTIHEAGHGLYEQGLPADAIGTPAGASVSLGIHESQSRLWENMVGRSKAFWTHYLPKLRALFPQQLSAVDLDAFYAAVNQVEPSLIRVEADEVTYNLHILLRFELECDLIEETGCRGRVARGVERADGTILGHPSSQRRPRRAPRHALVLRPTGLFPNLHTGQSVRSPVFSPSPPGLARPRIADRAGRTRVAQNLAQRKNPRPRLTGNGQRIGRGGHGREAECRLLHLLLVGEVRSALRPQPMTCCRNRSWFAPRILRTSASA